MYGIVPLNAVNDTRFDYASNEFPNCFHEADASNSVGWCVGFGDEDENGLFETLWDNSIMKGCLNYGDE